MTLQVDKLLLEHNNRPLKALLGVLKDPANQSIELPMAVIMDRRCGIERRTEEADGLGLVGDSPLILAICARRIDVTQALLAAGADPNAEGSDGINPLTAAIRNFDLITMESLICYGADVNAVDNGGKTPLHRAAYLGYTGLIELLDRSGPDLEAVDNTGQTPLHDAAVSSVAGTIEALLKLGVNQMAVDKYGLTPLHYAAASVVSVDAIEAFRYNVAAFEANLTVRDKNGQTPLEVHEPSHMYSRDDSKIRALLTPKYSPSNLKVSKAAVRSSPLTAPPTQKPLRRAAAQVKKSGN